MKSLKSSIASSLYRAGVSANFVTCLGLGFSGLSAFLILRGQFFWASAALLASGLLDLLDGAVARASGKSSAFGGILDSSLDRVGDGLVLGAVLFYFLKRGEALYAFLAFAGLLGSFLISYIRARAECEIKNCRVGFWERGERIGFLCLALSVNNLNLVLWILALGTLWTSAQRLYYSRQGVLSLSVPSNSRKKALYFLKLAGLSLLILFYRIS